MPYFDLQTMNAEGKAGETVKAWRESKGASLAVQPSLNYRECFSIVHIATGASCDQLLRGAFIDRKSLKTMRAVARIAERELSALWSELDAIPRLACGSVDMKATRATLQKHSQAATKARDLISSASFHALRV